MRHKIAEPTYEELLGRVRDLPEGYHGQIFEGMVHVTPPPSAARAHTLAEISAMLVAGSALGDPVPAEWAFLSNAEIAIGKEGFLVADFAGWHLVSSDLARVASPIRIAPSWVCEVLAAPTRTFTLTAKRREYAALGVSHLWIADPDAEVVDVFVNQRGRWLLVTSISTEENATAPPFEDLHFDAGDFWLPAPVKMPVVPPPPSSSKRRHQLV
jgi:hypothetical protein